jgi:hypothetical protein
MNMIKYRQKKTRIKLPDQDTNQWKKRYDWVVGKFFFFFFYVYTKKKKMLWCLYNNIALNTSELIFDPGQYCPMDDWYEKFMVNVHCVGLKRQLKGIVHWITSK